MSSPASVHPPANAMRSAATAGRREREVGGRDRLALLLDERRTGSQLAVAGAHLRGQVGGAEAHQTMMGFFSIHEASMRSGRPRHQRAAEIALTAGAITEDERRGWLEALHAEQARGPVIAGRLHIFTWGRKPA